jgi:enamine deaminase RidA (YjgF/YER057c/UK114 family)
MLNKTALRKLVSAGLVIGLAIALSLSSLTQALAQALAQDPAPVIAQSSPAIRYPIPNSDFPIAQAVEVSPNSTVVYLSGQVPSITNEAAEPNSTAAFGDTTAQTVNVLEKIDSILTSLEMSMGDVIKMQVFLVGDPDLAGKMDFEGFMTGYTQFLGTAEQPNLPARSTMQVAGLVNPGWLVEIEVTALRST